MKVDGGEGSSFRDGNALLKACASGELTCAQVRESINVESLPSNRSWMVSTHAPPVGLTLDALRKNIRMLLCVNPEPLELYRQGRLRACVVNG